MAWKKKQTRRKNPYNEDSSKTIHGLNSEDRVIKSLGGKVHAGSGALDGLKSDGVTEAGEYKFRIECKSTVKKSISLKHDWLKKIRQEAMQSNKIPMLTISFVDGVGNKKPAGDWCLIPSYALKDLLDEVGSGDT